MFSKSKNGVKGAIFQYICDTFEDESSETSYKLVSRNPDEILLRACDYGVPQARERLFLVGIRRDLLNISFKYPPKTFGPECDNPYITSGDAILDLPSVETGEESTQYQGSQDTRNSLDIPTLVNYK